MSHDYYENPLITRYSSGPMKQIFSDKEKVRTMRLVWIALAKAEQAIGLDISQDQVHDLETHLDNIDLVEIEQIEKQTKHDVMANVLAYGNHSKLAKPIIHLGATSCDITDNADILIYQRALLIIKSRIVTLMKQLSKFADEYKGLPTLGYTHFQAAQLTTVGKRATLWLHDVYKDYNYIETLLSNIKLKGLKGATGTQASYLHLCNNDSTKVVQLEQEFANFLGGLSIEPIASQTYSRKFDYEILSVLSQIAQSASKFSNDLRLLQHLKEVEEPFEQDQVGSSAMPYKRNPMKSERITSLSRYVLSLPINASITSSTQWFERTLDDSANRRIVLPSTFLAVDAIVNIYINLTKSLVVYPKIIEKHIEEELPFMMSENILMESVKLGKDRQEMHEKLKVISMEVAKNIKLEGKDNDLINRLKQDSDFSFLSDYLDQASSASNYIGLASSQVSNFLKNYIYPILEQNKTLEEITSSVDK